MKNRCLLRSLRRLSKLLNGDLARRALLLIVAALCLRPLSADAAGGTVDPCHERGEHQSLLFLLIDRSENVIDESGLTQSLNAVRELLGEGERVIIGVSTGAMSQARITLDTVRPAKSIWESPLKYRAREKRFKECLDDAFAQFTKSSESYPKSPLLETLHFAEEIMKTDPASQKRLVIISDMVQNSDAVSFQKAAQIDAAAALAKAEKEGLLARSLSGVSVWVAGAGVGVPDQKARQVESFWRAYFEKVGAALKFFGPILIAS